MLKRVRPFSAQQVPIPHSLAGFSWPETFKEGAPLDLEIGCGVGWHPIRYASQHPDRRVIAIEHTREKFARFESRLNAHKDLANLVAIHADAIAWVTHALKAETLDRVFILYPNPEPKAENKRWLLMPFMEKLIETMKPGGELCIATNSADYFIEAVDVAESEWQLETVRRRSFDRLNAPSQAPRTHFEKKYLQRGETCHDAIFRKRG